MKGPLEGGHWTGRTLDTLIGRYFQRIFNALSPSNGGSFLPKPFLSLHAPSPPKRERGGTPDASHRLPSLTGRRLRDWDLWGPLLLCLALGLILSGQAGRAKGQEGQRLWGETRDAHEEGTGQNWG